MRLIILLLLALVAGYGVLQIDKLDPNNYVKMYIAGYSIEVKLLGFLLLVLVSVIVLYFLVWLLRSIWRSPRVFSKWRERSNRDKAEQQLGAGYLSLIKGDWSKAESQLTSKSAYSKVQYVNYLAAAQAAQEQGRLDQRDEYLKSAYEAAPKERLAIGMTKARLHQQAGQMDLALATLDDIQELGKKNPQYTAMRLQTFEQNQDWAQAQPLLAVAKKQHALSDETLDAIRGKIHLSALRDADDIQAAWNDLPRDQRKQASHVAIYAKALAKKGETSAAEKLIRSTLKSSWSDELVSIYGSLPSNKPAKALRQVEGWLMARPENAELNLAAGRFALAAKNLDAAKQYLQTAISQAQLPEAYTLLGEVLESNNESGKALQLYRSGMVAMSKSDSPRLISDATETTS